MEADDEFAGLPVRCGACDCTQTLPFPGLKRLRLQCSECGSEFALSDMTDCLACGAPGSLRRWCHVHNCEVTGRACPRCIEEYARQFRKPKRRAVEPPEPSLPVSPPPPPPPPLPPARDRRVALPVERDDSTESGQALGPLALGFAAIGFSPCCRLVASALGVASIGWGLAVCRRVNIGTVPVSERPKAIAAIILGGLAILIDIACLVSVIIGKGPPP